MTEEAQTEKTKTAKERSPEVAFQIPVGFGEILRLPAFPRFKYRDFVAFF